MPETKSASANKASTAKSSTSKASSSAKTASSKTTAKSANQKTSTQKTNSNAVKTSTAKSTSTVKKEEQPKAKSSTATKSTSAAKKEPASSSTAKTSASSSKTAVKAKAESSKEAVPTKKVQSTRKSEPEKESLVEEKTAVTKNNKAVKKEEQPVRKEPKKPSAKKNQNDSNKKVKFIAILSAVCFAVLFIIVLISILSVKSCSSKKKEYTNEYKTSTRVGYEAEQIGTVKRNIPTEEKDEGMSPVGYPKYGYTLKDCIGSDPDKVALRNKIIAESSYLTTVNTWNGGGGQYNRFDSEGNLYLNDEPALDSNGQQRKLYRHTASVGLYGGDVSDDEPGVVKRITMSPRGYDRGYGVTGLYAPAGEIVKLEISGADMEATGGIVVHIGQALFNGKANNIWAAKNQMNRFPVILNTLNITKDLAEYDEEKDIYTAYLGSFVGGPVYIRNERVTFTVTISGAVNYSHFILGYTTKEEFEQNAKSSAPYFDLEVWEYGVLHSGPNQYAKPFSYDDLYDAAILWDKIALVSTQLNKQGIVFLYDPFVAAGAAVAFPGQGSVNCPSGWMSGSLNYKSFVNGGAWGNMHEYNHNFQGFGLGNGGEVTNNSLNLVSYSLFTRISSNRQIGTVNEGLGGWNSYTNASWALREITENHYSNGRYGLAIYANMLHNFGQEIYINSAKTSGGQSVDKWFLATMNASKHDMTYFYKDLIGYEVSDSVLNQAKEKNYPMFVPVASIYQTGRSFNYGEEKRYTETMQPYVIPYGEEYTLDLNKLVFENNIYQGGSIVIPDGFSYKIKSVSQPENGKIEDLGDNNYKFTPNESMYSGKIYVTLEITKNDNAFKVDDVELVMEFEQSHEMNKTMLERTTYTYSSDKMYTSATEAFEANYANYSEKVEGDNQNPILNGKVVQNGNAEVWFTEKPTTNQVIEVKGKMHVDELGKYRLSLRGRYNCALYASLDNGKTYELAATYIQDKTSSPNFPNTEGTYKDYELEADTWLYFKAVLIVQPDSSKNAAFIGVGWGKFTPAASILDEDGNEIGLIPESVKVSYASAYRESYEFSTSKFESDYFYKRTYTYSYNNNITYNQQQSIVSQYGYTPWSAEDHKLENLVDGKTNTYIHTNYTASEQKPLILNVDMGETIKANRMVLYTQSRSDPHCPKEFTLQGSLDGETFFDIGTFKDTTLSNARVTVDFEEKEFRYYRLTVTKSTGRYLIISKIEFANIFELPNANHISLDNKDVILKGEWSPESVLSSFGHVYVGKKNASLEFEFEGTRFGVLSSKSFGDKFEVYIDGKKVSSIDLKKVENGTYASFISDELSEGKHKVTIKCTGKANIDSILYW
ncbi:MAG: M60 family metallopeptidase [Anaeroplasmataceae bacterium]|nr:M60 family metallopeptidase [Anaeroplasmataceae bacterium]